MDIDKIKAHAKKLLSAEEQYVRESERIKDKQEKSDEARSERNYNIQLSKAKSAVQVQKLKENRIAALEKDADEAYLAQLKQTLEHEEAERDQHFRNIKYQLDAGVITESEYYAQLCALRDSYFAEGSKEWYKYSTDIAEYNKKVISDILSETAGEIERAREGVEKNLDKYTSLFTTVNSKYKKAGPLGSDWVITTTHLADLKKQTAVLQDYSNALTLLKARGEIPEGIFDELRSLDVESGLRFTNALLAADDAEFAAYIEAYTAHKQEMSALAVELTEDSTERAISVMKSKLEEVYGEIPEDFWQVGLESAQQFGSAFSEEIKAAFDEIKSQMAVGIADALSGSAAVSGTQNNNSYTASYNFYSSGETVSQQLQSARAAAVVERLRGGYDI